MTMCPPILSIVVPVYNTAPWLSRCIDSIISQTFKDWELILVDDGSNDGSGHICDDFANAFPNIRVIHKDNGGSGAARNKGLDIVRGKYITFVDSDDTITSGTYKENIMLLDQNADIDIVQFPCIAKYGTPQACRKYADRFSVFGTERQYQAWLSGGGISNYLWNKVFRREMFDNVRCREGMFFQDRHIMCALLQKSRGILSSGLGEYHYYFREGQATGQKESEFVLQSKIYADLNIVKHTVSFKSLLPETLERYSNCLYYGARMIKQGWAVSGESIKDLNGCSFSTMEILRSSVPKGIKLRCLVSKITGAEHYMQLRSFFVSE